MPYWPMKGNATNDYYIIGCTRCELVSQIQKIFWIFSMILVASILLLQLAPFLSPWLFISLKVFFINLHSKIFTPFCTAPSQWDKSISIYTIAMIVVCFCSMGSLSLHRQVNGESPSASNRLATIFTGNQGTNWNYFETEIDFLDIAQSDTVEVRTCWICTNYTNRYITF